MINTVLSGAGLNVRNVLALLGGIFFIVSSVSHSQSPDPHDITNDKVSISEMKPEVMSAFGRGRRNDPGQARTRGMVPTGLEPAFDERVRCRGIDETWAMDYSQKRGREAMHGGIDIPAPQGTPILAVADGVVVAKFMNEDNPKGIEIILRHSPEDTGHDIWTYTQYTHLLEMPDLNIGQQVHMGDVIGKTSNSGISGKEARRRHGSESSSGKRGGIEIRRHALHLGVMYSSSRKYLLTEKTLIPVDGFWMDPNAIYRKSPPFDSASLNVLPENEKRVAIPYMLPGGEFVPPDTRLIWPYTCSQK